MIAHLLSQKGPVLKNEGTKNNQIGVPLTLLKMGPKHQFAVLELGMSERGEIGNLSRMAAPTLGVITNIGPAHLAHLGSLGAVFACKMEILEGLEKGRALVVNRGDPFLKGATSLHHQIVFFGKGSAFRASHLEGRKAHQSYRFNDDLEGTLPLIGEHDVENALAAITVASLQGVSPFLSIERLKDFKGLEGRMCSKQVEGISFIDDTYNANPESTRRALESFAKLPTAGRRIFVMGDMLELGEDAPAYHAALGEEIILSGIDFFLAVGELSRSTHEKVLSLGMDGSRSLHVRTPQEAAKRLSEYVRKGDTVLVKGSRSMKMEEVIQTVASFTNAEVPELNA